MHSPAHHCASAATFFNSTTCFLSLSISALSDESRNTAAHTEAPWAALVTLSFLPQGHDCPRAPAKVSQHSVSSNHLYSSCSFHLGGFTISVRFNPYSLKCRYSHSSSAQPSYGGGLPSTRAPLWTQDATSPPPLQEPFIPGAIHITFALHQQLQKIVREWRIRTSIFSHGRVYLSQLLARLYSHGPSPKVANLPSQLGTAASKGDATELEDHHHFALTLEKGALHCKSSTSFGSTSRTLKRSAKQSFSHLNL